MKPIFTALAPNTQLSDAVLAFALLFRPWKWNAGKDARRLEEYFGKWLPCENAFAFSSGRACLYAILKALALKRGDEVLLQAYTCVAVPGPILWSGARPVYVDCEEKTFNISPADLERKITPKSRVLIIQHTFGLPADIDALMSIARKHNLFVIEDCAHALGAMYKSKRLGLPTEAQRAKVGTFGDAAFFSFGRDKVISSVFGGIATVSDRAIAGEVREILTHYNSPPWWWAVQQLLHPIVAWKTKFFFRIGLGPLILIIAKTTGLISKAVYADEKRGGKPGFEEYRLSDALARLALRQLDKLALYNAHRQQIAKMYSEELDRAGLQNIVRPKGDGHIYLRYTLRTPDAERLLKESKKQKIFLGDWYRTPIAPDGVDYSAVHYVSGSCPTAEKLAGESINLPTDIHISAREVQRIVAFLKGNIF